MNEYDTYSTKAQEASGLEQRFALRQYAGDPKGPTLLLKEGTIPIILTAPHAVNHPRLGQLKLADLYTGAIALQVAALTGVHALILAQTTEEDPNYDEDGPYKRRLSTLIAQTQTKCVLDLHGLSLSNPYDFILGTNDGQTLGIHHTFRNTVRKVFTQAGLANISIDNPDGYNARRHTTISSFVNNVFQVPAMQLEINKRYRSPDENPQAYTLLISTLQTLIATMYKHFCFEANEEQP